jgi:hypothetical protein
MVIEYLGNIRKDNMGRYMKGEDPAILHCARAKNMEEIQEMERQGGVL